MMCFIVEVSTYLKALNIFCIVISNLRLNCWGFWEGVLSTSAMIFTQNSEIVNSVYSGGNAYKQCKRCLVIRYKTRCIWEWCNPGSPVFHHAYCIGPKGDKNNFVRIMKLKYDALLSKMYWLNPLVMLRYMDDIH